LHPGLVADWKASWHARHTPEQALKKPERERRISAQTVPAHLKDVVVGCYECHGLRTEAHQDTFEHYSFQINVVVSPDDCATCHPVEVSQYGHSKKAHAIDNLKKNAIYNTLVETVTRVATVSDAGTVSHTISNNAQNETCLACHGTNVQVIGKKKMVVDGDELEIPILSNWPNQGVGRHNPDGSYGACTACHARHEFSIAVARQPYTCAQCHLEPDVPAWNVYQESKHGNIFMSSGKDWNWQQVPWRVGEDFRTPTCATCHNSLVVSPEGDVIAERTHDFGSRLWVRIFGLIYSHPQPLSGKTHELRNADGQPLPATFAGVVASEGLIDSATQQTRKNEMKQLCRSCHSSEWANGHFEKMDSTLVETDRMVLASTKLMQHAWQQKVANSNNPFDEEMEQYWVKQWLFYANSVRYGSAMGGPDYAAFKNGWWSMTHNLAHMHKELKNKQK
jgi:hypothetical protein